MRTQKTTIGNKRTAGMPSCCRAAWLAVACSVYGWFFNPAAFADVVAGNLASGGGYATSTTYCVVASLGGIGGLSSEGAVDDIAGGVVIQPAALSLTLTVAPASVNQGNTSQLSGTAVMDDQTITSLVGNDIVWGSVAYPFHSLDTNGVLTAVANVYACPAGTVTGVYFGIAGRTSIPVLGPYAASGIPDAWFMQYFGVPPNSLADPTVDASGTGQNNLFKYIAGLNPTNPASVFTLRIASVAGHLNQQNLVFSPRMTDRSYVLQFTTNLLIGGFTPMNFSVTNDVGAQRTVTDLQATNACRFYRVQISSP